MPGAFTREDWVLEKKLQSDISYVAQRDNVLFYMEEEESSGQKFLVALNLETGSKQVFDGAFKNWHVPNPQHAGAIAFLDQEDLNVYDLKVMSLLPETLGKILFIKENFKHQDYSWFLSQNEEFLLYEKGNENGLYTVEIVRLSDGWKKKLGISDNPLPEDWHQKPSRFAIFDASNAGWDQYFVLENYSLDSSSWKLYLSSNEVSGEDYAAIKSTGLYQISLGTITNQEFNTVHNAVTVFTEKGIYSCHLWGINNPQSPPLESKSIAFSEEELKLTCAGEEGIIKEYYLTRSFFEEEEPKRSKIPLLVHKSDELGYDYNEREISSKSLVYAEKSQKELIGLKEGRTTKEGLEGQMSPDGKRAFFRFLDNDYSSGKDTYSFEIYVKKEIVPEKDQLLMELCSESWKNGSFEVEYTFLSEVKKTRSKKVLNLPQGQYFIKKYNGKILSTFSWTIENFLQENPENPFPLPEKVSEAEFESFWTAFFRNEDVSKEFLFEYLDVSVKK